MLVEGGDGDGYGIGLSHLIHSARRNLDVTDIVMDNQTYGLTKGQVSPTSPQGFVTKTTPEGNAEAPVEPLVLALLAGTSYLSSAFSNEMKLLTALICITYNRERTFDWYREHLVDLGEGHDPSDFQQALQLVARKDGTIPNGRIYTQERPALVDAASHRIGGVSPAREDLGKTLKTRRGDLGALMRAFA